MPLGLGMKYRFLLFQNTSMALSDLGTQVALKAHLMLSSKGKEEGFMNHTPLMV